MFTAEQIKIAHSKVKSGADFPAYIQEIKLLGVIQYEAYVTDGRVDYYGTNGYTLQIPQKYEPLSIVNHVQEEEFKAQLLAHQQGKTDYLSFIHMCADTGIEKWRIHIPQMTCTYFDKAGREVLTEQIP
jgi:uncharacterized protein YbcV (DUF1398 family)